MALPKCACGCGEDVYVPTQTAKRLGYKKGVPQKYARHHGARRWGYDVDENGCWIWKYSVCSITGYGKGAGRLAHRVSYERHVGPIPEGLELDHLCGVRVCINPEHLEPVTHLENARRGKQTKLRLEEVQEIKRLSRAGVQHKTIAAMFRISQNNVSHIMHGRSWKEVA